MVEVFCFCFCFKACHMYENHWLSQWTVTVVPCDFKQSECVTEDKALLPTVNDWPYVIAATLHSCVFVFVLIHIYMCVRACEQHLCTEALCASLFQPLCASMCLCVCAAFHLHPHRASLPHTLIKMSSLAGPSILSVECSRLVGIEREGGSRHIEFLETWRNSEPIKQLFRMSLGERFFHNTTFFKHRNLNKV